MASDGNMIRRVRHHFSVRLLLKGIFGQLNGFREIQQGLDFFATENQRHKLTRITKLLTLTRSLRWKGLE